MTVFFKRISWACPEQYDVICNGEQVAYVRLRGGHLTAEKGDCGGPLIYEHIFDDKYKGMFDSDEECEKYLRTIMDVLCREYCWDIKTVLPCVYDSLTLGTN